MENLFRFRISSDLLMCLSSLPLEMSLLIKYRSKSGKGLILSSLDLMAVEKAHYSEFLVDFGPSQEELLRDPALKSCSTYHKDLICPQAP